MKSDTKKVNERNVEAFSEFGGLIKHAARYLLWLPEANSLRIEKRRFLKYFTLPGKYAYDILFFERNGIIQRQGRGFPDVRFCDNNLQAYSTAKKLLGNTVGKKGNFEDLVLNNEREFWDSFPYDLYNLDFSGTCFPDDQPPFSDTFKAIVKIIKRHVSHNKFPFVVFLTMKALARETKDEAKEQLKENIETNRRDANFAQEVNSLIPNTENFANTRFVDFIIISIPKLICYLTKDYCDIEIRNRAKYSRTRQDGSSYFITKFIFKFIRRRQRSLRIRNDRYVNNVLNIMRLDDVRTIDNSCINRNIRRSRDKLKQEIASLIQ